MTTTAQLIKRHINGLQPAAIFCTRDLLGYGKRNIVDNVLYRLAKKGRITRLARGVYCRAYCRPTTVTTWHILDAKMKAWGKVYWFEKANTPDEQLNKQETRCENITVYVSGKTSSFATTDGKRCHLQSSGPRKMKLGQTPAGSLAREIWNRGRQQLTPLNTEFLVSHLRGVQVTEFLCLFRLLPAWINDKLQHLRITRFGASLSEVCRLGAESSFCQLEQKLRPV